MTERLSDLWKDLKPLVIAEIERYPSSTRSSGAPSPHEVGGVHHVGSARRDQYPDAVLTDGSRMMTGNLNMAAGRTVDGVDISELNIQLQAVADPDSLFYHINDPVAHHDPFVGLRVNGTVFDPWRPSDWAVWRATDDPGLWRMDFVEGFGQDLTTSTDVDGRTSITWAVQASDNPGATSSVLKTTAAGGLTLRSLATTLGATIGDDLIVGSGSGVLNVDVGGAHIAMGGEVHRTGPAATNRGYRWGTGTAGTTGSIRWYFYNDNSAEAGANAGSDLLLARYSDAGAFLANVFTVDRATGLFTFNSNVSMAGTLTVSGAATVGSLVSQGDASIAQDLLVGPGVGVLNVDVSGQRVGINMAADPQFDLDVLGSMRVGGYYVGRHALQVKGAMLIAHFDSDRYMLRDLDGETRGHKGQVPSPTGELLFWPGKFGGSIAVGEAATNLFANAIPRVNATGWAAWGSGSTVARVVDDTAPGGFAVGHTAAAIPVSGHGITGTWTAVVGQVYNVSLWFKGIAGENYRLWTGNTSGTPAWGTVDVVGTGDWQMIQKTTTAATTTTARWILQRLAATATLLRASAVQVVNKAYFVPFTETSRVASSIFYPASGNIRPDQGTVMAWVWIPSGQATNNRVLSVQGLDEDGVASHVILRVTTAGAMSCYWGGVGLNSSGGVVPFDTWTHIAQTQDGTTQRLYVNGVQVASGTGFGKVPELFNTGLYVGGHGATDITNGFLDEVAVIDRPLPAEELLAIYESDAPIFAETSTFHFRTGNGLVWADEEGLWMRDTTGAAVLGVIGVNGKSWGGRTNDAGDLLIGSVSSGKYALWDNSAASFLVRGTIQATDGIIDGILTIGTSGEIRQGTGTIGSNFTGFRLWKDTNFGRIGGYNNNVLQWYAGADGKLYAGGGNVIIDANGITLVEGVGIVNQLKWGANSVISGFGGTAPTLDLFTVTPAATSSSQISLTAQSSDAPSTGFTVRSPQADSSPAGEIAMDFYETGATFLMRYSGVTRHTFGYNLITIGAATTNLLGSLDVDGSAIVGSTSTFTGLATFNGGATILGKFRRGGAAFPASPVADDTFYRTDLNLEFVYDGTNWVSINEYPIPWSRIDTVAGLQPFAATVNPTYAKLDSRFNVKITAWTVRAIVNAGANDAANHWLFSLRKFNILGSNTQVHAGGTTNGSGNGNFETTYTMGVNVTTTGASRDMEIFPTLTKVGAPGNLYFESTVYYRIVAT